MINQKIKDKKKRGLCVKYESEVFVNHGSTFLKNKKNFFKRRNKLNINRTVNRCVVSLRSRGVIRKYKLARASFRQLASYGLIPGVQKSSW